MKKFRIETVEPISRYMTFEVEAQTEKEARELVLSGEVDEIKVEEFTDDDVRIGFVEEIEFDEDDEDDDDDWERSW